MPENKDDIDLKGWDLHRAAEENRLDIARSLIVKGYEVDEEGGEEGGTPLHHAASNNFRDVARLLIENGANIEQEDWDGCTPLHKAAQEKSLDLARLLLAHGAEVDARNEDDSTPLILLIDAATDYAGYDSCYYIAWLLIEHGADVNAKGDNGETPLGYVVGRVSYKSGLDLAQLLIEHGADVNLSSGDSWFWLPRGAPGSLLYGVLDGDMELEWAHLLLQHGADVNFQDRSGQRSLHKIGQVTNIASVSPHYEGSFVDRLKERLDRNQDYLDIAQLLIERGADVNGRDHNGDTAMHLSSYEAIYRLNNMEPVGFCIDFINLLIEHGANTDGIDLSWMDEQQDA